MCDNDKRAQIKKYQYMSVDELSAVVEMQEEKLKAAEENFNSEVEKLHARYGQLSKEKDDAIAGIKAVRFGLLNSVLMSI
jgi:hypothetical protein